MKRIALYPGTFDPPTNGHLDIIARSSEISDYLIVAIGINSSKAPLFSFEERSEMLRAITADIPNVEVRTFDKLLVHFAKEVKANLIIRGLRAISDFEFELQLALMNRRLDKTIDTIFLMPDERYSYLNSTVVKEVARLGGDVSTFVPPVVAERLKEKFASK